ncbi:DUF4123 domain-containing protein, partial [Vibrio sp. ZSDE26]
EEQVYALIEPTVWKDWKEQLLDENTRDVSQTQAIPLFNQTRFSQVESGPVLVHLNNSECALKLCTEQFETKPSGCLVYANESIELATLLASLRSRVVVKKGKAEMLIRFNEPRQLVMLMGSMNEYERREFFPALSRLHWYNRDWLSVDLSHIPIDSSPSDIWSLSEERLDTMQNIASQWRLS